MELGCNADVMGFRSGRMRALPAHAHNLSASFARFTERMARFHAGRRWLPIGAARAHVAGDTVADDTLVAVDPAGFKPGGIDDSSWVMPIGSTLPRPKHLHHQLIVSSAVPKP